MKTFDTDKENDLHVHVMINANDDGDQILPATRSFKAYEIRRRWRNRFLLLAVVGLVIAIIVLAVLLAMSRNSAIGAPFCPSVGGGGGVVPLIDNSTETNTSTTFAGTSSTSVPGTPDVISTVLCNSTMATGKSDTGPVEDGSGGCT